MDPEMLWEMIDKKGRGFLSQEELYRALTETSGIEVGLPRQALVRLLAEADYSGSGYVEKTVFVEVFGHVQVLDASLARRVRRLRPQWYWCWYFVVALLLASLLSLFGLVMVRGNLPEDAPEEQEEELLFWRNVLIVISAHVFALAVALPLMEFWLNGRAKWESWRSQIGRTEDLARADAVERLARRGECQPPPPPASPPAPVAEPPPPPAELPPELEAPLTYRVTVSEELCQQHKQLSDGDGDGSSLSLSLGGSQAVQSWSRKAFLNVPEACDATSCRPTSASSRKALPGQGQPEKAAGWPSEGSAESVERGTVKRNPSQLSLPAPNREGRALQRSPSQLSPLALADGRPPSRSPSPSPGAAAAKPPSADVRRALASLPALRDIGRKPVELPGKMPEGGPSWPTRSCSTGSTLASPPNSRQASRPGSAAPQEQQEHSLRRTQTSDLSSSSRPGSLLSGESRKAETSAPVTLFFRQGSPEPAVVGRMTIQVPGHRAEPAQQHSREVARMTSDSSTWAEAAAGAPRYASEAASLRTSQGGASRPSSAGRPRSAGRPGSGRRPLARPSSAVRASRWSSGGPTH